jgi:hypothetical protein
MLNFTEWNFSWEIGERVFTSTPITCHSSYCPLNFLLLLLHFLLPTPGSRPSRSYIERVGQRLRISNRDYSTWPDPIPQLLPSLLTLSSPESYENVSVKETLAT